MSGCYAGSKSLFPAESKTRKHLNHDTLLYTRANLGRDVQNERGTTVRK